MPWRTRPLFVSSTFNDFQAERHVLQTFVFPALAERLRERRHDLEPVDLRTGVETAAEADEVRKTLLVLRVCLAEVERSRPFLVILVGDCYGWVPPAERARQAAAESGLDCDVDGKSITHLEVELGVLRHPSPMRTFAYFRHLDLDSVPPQLRGRYRDADTGRVAALRDRVREVLGDDRCRGYDASWDAARNAVGGLDDFHRMVQEDIWRDLDDETRSFPAGTRDVLDTFVHDTARDFTGREALLVELSTAAIAGSRHPGVCVVGPPGSGKSSVAAELVRRLRDDPSLLLLAHAAGIEGQSVRIDRVLRRWCGELGDAPGEEVIGEELEHTFARLLTRAASDRRVVLVLDALNELERGARARRLTWLPPLWPANAVLIATTTPGPEADSFRRRPGFRTVALEPLTGDDASRVADAVYRRYRRQVNPDVKGILLAKQTPEGAAAAGNPLWLELACEEMNLLDPEEIARATGFKGAPDMQLARMQGELARQLPATAQGIYGRMLRRAGEVAAEIARSPDEATARDWLRCLSELVAVSRNGWRESDLRSLLGRLSPVFWSELLFASVRRAYRGHLIQRGSSGLWSFYHGELRRGVLTHFSSPGTELARLHAAAAAHLATLPPDNPLRVTERMHHLIGSDDRAGAAELYASAEHSSNELRAQTESLADLVRTRADAIDWIGGLLDVALSSTQLMLLAEKIMYPLHDALSFEGRVEERRALLSRVRDRMARLADAAPPGPGRELASRQHAVALLRLADLDFDGGDFASAEELYTAYAGAGLRGGLDRGVAFERLGTLAERRGDRAAARAAYQHQLAAAEAAVASKPVDVEPLRMVAAALERLGTLALDDGDPEASASLSSAATVHERVASLTGQTVATGALAARAQLAEADGDPGRARELLERLENALHERALAAPEDVEAQVAWLIGLQQLGDATAHDGDRASAQRSFRTAVDVAADLAARLPDDVTARRTWSTSLEKLGDTLLHAKDYAAARPAYEQSLRIRIALHDRLPDDIRGRRDLGLAYERLGGLEDQPAERRVEHLERAVALYTALYEELPDNEKAGRTLALGHFALAQALAGIPERKDEVMEHSSRAHELLSDLRAHGRRIEPEAERVLTFLDTRFGGSGRWTHPVQPDREQAYAELNLLGMTGSQALAAGDYPAAERDFRRSLELAQQIDHPPSAVRACGSLGEVRTRLGDTTGAVALLTETIALAREHHLAVEEGQTLSRLAALQSDTGDTDAAQHTYEERIALAERVRDQRGWALGSAALGQLHFERHRYAMAVDRLTGAAEALEKHRMWPELALTWSYLGVAYQALGDAWGAADAYRNHIEVCRDLGNPAAAAGSMANLSGVLHAMGQRAEAISLGEEAVRHLPGAQAGALRARIAEWRRR